MAEGARLESVFRGNSNVGSNPTLSAISLGSGPDFFDFLDAHGLPGEDRAETNFFAVQTDASAVGDVNDAVVKRISKFWQSAIATRGRM